MQEEVLQDPPVSKGEKLYKNLLATGFTEANLGKQDEFLKALQDPMKANTIYSGLRSAGFSEANLGTMKEFQTSFTPPKPTADPLLALKAQRPTMVVDNTGVPNPRKTKLKQALFDDKRASSKYVANAPLSGIGKLASGIQDVMVNLLGGLGAEDVQDFEKIVKDVRQDNNTLREAPEKVLGFDISKKDRDLASKEFITGALRGLGESVPAMLTPSGSGLYIQAYDNGIQQINNTKEGAELPEWAKTTYGATVGLAQGALEKVGLSKIIKSPKILNSVTNKLVGNVFKKLSKEGAENVSSEVVDQLVKKEASVLANKVRQVGAKALSGFAVETGTGTLQETAQVLTEIATNQATGKKVFDVPTFGEAVGRIVKSGLQEGIGGGIIGGAVGGLQGTQAQIRDEVANASPDQLNQTADELAQSIGEDTDISPEDAEHLLNKTEQYVNAAQTIPADVPPTQKSEIIEHIVNRNEIDSTISEKQAELEQVDEAFKPQIENEIAVLNEQRKGIDNDIQEILKTPIDESNNQENSSENTQEEGGSSNGEEIGQEAEQRQDVLNKDGEVLSEPAPKNTLQILEDFGNAKEYPYSENHKFSGKSDFQATDEDGYKISINPTKEGYMVSLGKPGKDVGGVDSFNEIQTWFPENDNEMQSAIAEAKLITERIKSKNNDTTNTLTANGDNAGTIESPTGEIQIDETIQPEAQESRSEAAQGENITTLRNAEVEAKRKEYGFDEPLPRKGATNEELSTKADEQIAEGYDAHELMDKVLDEKKPITGVESVILAKFQGAKEDELLSINDKIEKSVNKSDATFNQLLTDRQNILDELHRAYKASEASGTVASDALRARQVKILRDYSLANLLIRKREANGGKKLTEEQLQEVTATYMDLKAKEEALNKKIAELQNQENELLAKQTVRKLALEARREKRTQKTEVIDKEIEDVFASLKKIAKEQRKTLSANPIPIEYIPEIAKLVKLYTKKGVVSLEGVVDNIYNGLKDDFEGLTKEHVKEVIGSLSENDPQKAVKTRMRTAIKDFKRRTTDGDFTKKKREPIKLDKEGLELRDALEKARYEYELALHRDAYKNRTKTQKARDVVTEVMNVPRALMASTDMSAPLRQGLIPTISHPIKASQAFIHMFKSAASNKTFDRWFYDLRESPDYANMKESKLYIADPHKPELAAKEEQFMSNIANRIPFLGKLVAGSERAYVAYLNKLRVDLFRQSADLFEMEGKTVANSPDLYKGLAKWINNATGRGTFTNEQLAQSLNSVLFSPRLIASRVNLLNPIWYAKLPKEVRKQALADMVKVTAVVLSALTLASLNGLEVELDPRSSDFAKIKSGDKRWDILGGFSQYIRFFAQLLTGQTKSTTTGRIKELNDGSRFSRTKFDVALAMGRSKLAPVPAFAINTLAGKDAIGKEFEPIDAIPRLIIPLTVKDTYEAIEEEGLKGLFTTGLPATFGVGVQTYNDKK